MKDNQSSTLLDEYKAKPVKKYYKPFNIQKQTFYKRGFEKRVQARIEMHGNFEEFKKHRFGKMVKWILLILFFCSGLGMISFSGIYSDGNGGYVIPENNSTAQIMIVIGSILCGLSLISWLIYGIYSCIFFQYSQMRFQKTQKYETLVKQYNSTKKLKGINGNKIKLLYKMDIISKEVYNLIKYRRKHNITADGDE